VALASLSQWTPARGSSPDGLESLDSVLALLHPTLPNDKPTLATNPLIIAAVGAGSGSLVAGAVKAAVTGALSQSMGGVAAGLAGDTVGEVVKGVVSGLFEQLKAQSATDKKIKLQLVEPLNTAKRHIRRVFLADWVKFASSQRERDDSLRVARNRLVEAETTVSDYPDLLAKVEALLALTNALVPDFRPWLEVDLKSFRDKAADKRREADVSEGIFGSPLSRGLVRLALPRVASLSTSLSAKNLMPTQQVFAPKSTWTSFQNVYPTLGYLHWTVLPLLGALVGLGGTQGIGIAFIISQMITEFGLTQQTVGHPLTPETLQANAQLKALELRKSADRTTRYCGLLEGIADNRDEFFRVIREYLPVHSSKFLEE
jgi:hypothetical protein